MITIHISQKDCQWTFAVFYWRSINTIKWFGSVRQHGQWRNIALLCDNKVYCISWWRHQMETFSALLDLCARNSTVTGEFQAQMPVMRNFDVSLICVWINDWVNNPNCGDLRRHRGHYDVTVMFDRGEVKSLDEANLYFKSRTEYRLMRLPIDYQLKRSSCILHSDPIIRNGFFFLMWFVISSMDHILDCIAVKVDS